MPRPRTDPVRLVCRGLDPDTGTRCGKTYNRDSIEGNPLDAARAAGWKLGHRADGTPDAMCPACAKPDPATVALIRDLKRSLT